MHALVLAGGRGTRLRPLTDTRPKPLMPFCGDPFAAGLLRRLATVGVRHVSLLIARDPAPYAVLEPLGKQVGVTVEAVTEEQALDTAGAARRVLQAPHDGPVLVCNGDILTDLDFGALVSAHERAQATATLALTRVADTSAFGVVECDTGGRVRRFVEKPPPGTVAADTVNAGTYVLDPGAFDAFPGDGPLSFEREVFPGLLERGATVLGHMSDAFWADLGTPERYLDGTAAVLAGTCRWPVAQSMQAAGQQALVHASARVGAATLRPGTVIGAGCAVADGAELDGTVLFDAATVGAGAQLTRCILGEGAAVAPDERLTGVVLGDGARASGAAGQAPDDGVRPQGDGDGVPGAHPGPGRP
jgi:mannose-1-phosphate guanylyltransferase